MPNLFLIGKVGTWLDLHYLYLNNWHVVPGIIKIKAPELQTFQLLLEYALQTYLDIESLNDWTSKCYFK